MVFQVYIFGKKIGLSLGGENLCFSDIAKEAFERKPSFPHVNKTNTVNFKVEMNGIVCSWVW